MNRSGSVSRRQFLTITTTVAGAAALGTWETCPGLEPGPGKPLVIRGHHLFDMLEALGTGKSSHKTLGPVAQKVRANPQVPLKIVVGVDDICSPCEWWDHAKSHCKRSLTKYPQDNANSLTSDANAIRVLGLKAGEVVNADELYRRIRVKVTKRVFAEEVCVACRLVDKCKETYEGKIAAAVEALRTPHLQ